MYSISSSVNAPGRNNVIDEGTICIEFLKQSEENSPFTQRKVTFRAYKPANPGKTSEKPSAEKFYNGFKPNEFTRFFKKNFNFFTWP